MKKILLLILFYSIPILSTSQIFTKIEHLDKFDDVIKTENVKTLIEICESISDNITKVDLISFQTKGKEEQIYISVYKMEIGKRDSIVNLVDDIYGYQTNYHVFNAKDSVWFIDNVYRPFMVKLNTDSTYINGLKECYYAPTSHPKVSLDDFILGFNWLAFGIYFSNLDDDRVYEITDRHITTKYSGEHLDNLIWLRRNNKSRIIYTNEK